jgi:hypothetical protein
VTINASSACILAISNLLDWPIKRNSKLNKLLAQDTKDDRVPTKQ